MMKQIYILSCEKDGGIYRYLLNNGEARFVEKTTLDWPMYAIIRDNKMYIILREVDTKTHFGGILSFDIDENGKLINPTNIESTSGIVPCHLEVTDNGCYVVNYLSGNIVKIGEKIVTHSGKGVHHTRQEAPHTHFVCASPDKNHILCTDLGLDKIFVYDENLNEKFSVELPAGSGPRHLCFSQNGQYLYCINELSNDVSVLLWNDGKPVLKGTYAAIPNYKEESTAAAIRIKGDFLYTSNRGADTISCFKITEEGLTLLSNTFCGGNGPRDFNLFGDMLVCTNENSHNVTFFEIEKDGLKKMNLELNIKSPLCVLEN